MWLDDADDIWNFKNFQRCIKNKNGQLLGGDTRIGDVEGHLSTADESVISGIVILEHDALSDLWKFQDCQKLAEMVCTRGGLYP